MKHPMLNTAVKAARAAGKLINQSVMNLDSISVQKKGPNDFVTEIDHQVEQLMVEVLSQAYPDHAFLLEESGFIKGKSDDPMQEAFLWAIDPIDGTKNFMHGFHRYCVSIALMQNGVPTVGVIYAPFSDELFTAVKGAGAYVDDRRMRVAKRDRIDEAMIATGFPYRIHLHDEGKQKHDIDIIRGLNAKSVNLRRTGSAALDLAEVAAGRLDGYFDIGLKAWDIAAGALMVQEAGGYLGNMQGDKLDYMMGDIVAASPKVFTQLVPILSGKIPQR